MTSPLRSGLTRVFISDETGEPARTAEAASTALFHINPSSFKLAKSWSRPAVRWPRMMWSRTEMLRSSPALTRRLVR
jgi:hypothetical protein